MSLRNSIQLVALTVALLFGVAAAAQDYQAQQPPAETIDVSDQQLQQFANAQGEISEIQQDFSTRLQDVDDPEKAHELQMEANDEMTAAVESAGLDVQTFNQIAMAIQSDPELQQQLSRMLQ